MKKGDIATNFKEIKRINYKGKKLDKSDERANFSKEANYWGSSRKRKKSE